MILPVFFIFFTTLDIIWPKSCPKTTPNLIFFAGFQWSMLGNSINFKNFDWNPVVLKTSKNYYFLAQLVQNWSHHGPRPKQKNNVFFQKQQNEILSFQNLFILTKYRVFWLSYECFSRLCNAFLLKSAISSDNSRGITF